MQEKDEKNGGDTMHDVPETTGREHYDPKLTRSLFIAGMTGLGLISVAVVIYFLASV